MPDVKKAILDEVLEAFDFGAPVVGAVRYGCGHINDTYKVDATVDGTRREYILQKMNKTVFKRPDLLMENMVGVTDFLGEKVRAAGGDVEREVMGVYRTLDGDNFVVDSEGEYWRVVVFITDSISYDKVENPEQFYLCAVAFGEFQRLLSDYPAETLHETIVNFHNTEVRYENLMKSAEVDAKGRKNDVIPEIKFVTDRREFTSLFENKRREGALPLKVTHNDTKLNNILFDKETDKPVCVVDLDTIMPGYSINDFGDSIRFGASLAAEDETELDKVSMSLELFELYVKGFIEGVGSSLTDTELSLMPESAIMMTLECGMRFLTDYLDGDVYFRIKHPSHNLDRARNQFKLVQDMESKIDKMHDIVNKYIQM